MSQLLILRQAVIDRIAAAMPAGWDVQGHLGRFTPNDLNAFLMKAPAVRVAILGLSDSVSVDEDAIDVRVRMAVYVLTRDKVGKLDREVIAAAAVETIVLLALGNRWGQTFARPSLPATAQTIFSDETLSKGVALWAIDLPVPVVLARPEEGTNAITELFLGLAPEVGPDHLDDYLGPITVAPTDLDGGPGDA